MKKTIVLLLIIIFIIGCSNVKKNTIIETYNFTKKIDYLGYITSYTIYGNFFNLEGYINDNNKDLKLVLKSNNNELEYEIISELKDNRVYFKTNKLINEGINLEEINNGNYLVLLKSNNNYYTLAKKNKYNELNYYTITKDKKNKEINISFMKFDDKEYLMFNVNDTDLPNNIYDIVIDPGHGGKDVGASSNGNHESDFTLDYSLSLKEKLEDIGLKVKITRDKDVSIPNYGESGRVSIPYQVKAKLMLSIHLNSSNSKTSEGGVEIYVPNNANLSFAKDLANNIVSNTSTIYSKNPESRIDNGVYLRTLSKSDIENMKKDAIENNYTPYEKASTSSTYYYIIRETGGIITGAYNDDRNPKKDGNPYVNSNHGCESYLVELGYITSSKNLEILKQEKEKYIDAIVKSVKDYLEIS